MLGVIEKKLKSRTNWVKDMRLKLYTDFAIKDVFRLWSASQLQVIIIAGICLPILMLLGLKNGHVADLREDLVTSPTGRQVIFWSAKEGDFLTKEVLHNLGNEIPNVDMIIPDCQKLVFASGGSEGIGEGKQRQPLTLYSTAPGDPILQQFGADIGSPSDLSLKPVVLQQSAAEVLGLAVGDEFDFLVKRRLGADEEEHVIQSVVTSIVSTGSSDKGLVGYANIEMMAGLEKYSSGGAVDELGIAAMPSLRAVDRYQEMLFICFRDAESDLSDADFEFLSERGLKAVETNDPEVATLYGNLKTAAKDKIKIYNVRFKEKDAVGYIRDNPSLLTRNTQARDDLALRWCSPKVVSINGQKMRFVGLTLPTKKQEGGWLQTFLNDDTYWFTYEESAKTPMIVRGRKSVVALCEGREVPLAVGLNVLLEKMVPIISESSKTDLVNQESQKDDTSEINPALKEELATSQSQKKEDVRTVFVPVSLLAFVDQFALGDVVLEKVKNCFIPTPKPIAFTKARMYTRTIDDVPSASNSLAEKRFAVLSEVSRIAEIQEQDGSLRVLVLVVALGVFIFGVITVFSVLVDSTDRKKGLIGILRVMGVSGPGVFVFLLVRAIVIGVMAAGLCCAIGVFLASVLSSTFNEASFLSWLPQIHVVLRSEEYGVVTLGAILCASLGVLIPALKASRLDPFDALMEGQFN